MRAYHVDGLRLDLAAILDDATLAALREATLAEYPRAILISEPWSMAGYRPADLARMGHTVWNDRFRNGIKGQNPHTGQGFIFGQAAGGANRQDVCALLAGSPRSLGGLFDDASLTLNYLESHDDLTLGDFIRLALGEAHDGEKVRRDAMAVVHGHALRVHKLAAAALLLSRGAVMLAQGQEWGRAKVQDQNRREHAGPLDGNSYNRDDATNHLDWRERHANGELVDQYRRLIALRKSWLIPAMLAGKPMRPLWGSALLSVGYQIETPRGVMAVLLNGAHEVTWFDVAGGPWWLLLGAENGHIVPTKNGVSVKVQPTAAVVLYATAK
jgi:pullulanase